MSPSLELLNGSPIGTASDLPLHAQVRRVLRGMIEEHFEDGQKFWTETALMEYLEVSQGTVRRALMDLTREGLLQRQAAKGSFVRKAGAQQVCSVGVFVPEYDSELYTVLIDKIADECATRNYRLHVYHTHKGEKIEDASCQVLRTPQEERIILLANPPQPTWRLFEAFDMRGYRTVNIGMPITGYPGSYVGVDGDEGVRLALDHLTELGHRRIALLVNEPLKNPAIAARVRVFEELREAKNLVESFVVDCRTEFWESSYHAAYSKMEEVFGNEDGSRPTALFAVSDQGAWAALKWLAERGIKVPSEISVMGYDDVRTSQFMHPALTSVAQPARDIARVALEILWQDKPGAISRLLPPTLSLRESTAMAAGN